MSRKVAALLALQAEASLKLWTAFLGITATIAHAHLVRLGEVLPASADTINLLYEGVPVEAVVAAIAVTVLFEELAERLPRLDVLMQVSAVLALLTEALQVVDADLLLMLGWVVLVHACLRQSNDFFDAFLVKLFLFEAL